MATSRAPDRIAELRIRGLRTLADVHLKLGPETIVIGANGSGKSSIAEACVILYELSQPNFATTFLGRHRGYSALRRFNATTVEFSVRVEGMEDPLQYDISLGDDSGALVIRSESLHIDPHRDPTRLSNIFERKAGKAKALTERKLHTLDGDTGKNARIEIEIAADVPLVSAFGIWPPHPAISRLSKALNQIYVQIGFATTPVWAAGSLGVTRSLRDTEVTQPADRLDFGGLNIANAFHALRNDKPTSHWDETMEYVRLGLGTEIESVAVKFDPGGGRSSLELKWSGDDKRDPAWALSDGQLSYLAFVAMFRLETPASLIVFDGPETHLHPGLIQRVMGFFDKMSERTNVLLFTHSDRLLDSIPDPAASTILLELNQRREALVRRPSAPQLERWLETYNGIGSLRAEGYEAALFAEPEKEPGGNPRAAEP